MTIAEVFEDISALKDSSDLIGVCMGESINILLIWATCLNIY